ncbi:alanine--tRNA ligase-related protein [Patescibacteria group bacterium]|nr:alanine--tRNA ligase-related protein [Patescibacteria group bacterium]
MKTQGIINSYIDFFQKRGHKRIPNSPLVPQNDPTTLFTSSGMQPLLPYFLGESHPSGKKLVNVQNCFRAADIDEVGDNRHTTFFRMLGNWSLGDYFKKEEIPWLWEFLTKGLGLPKEKLYISVFSGDGNVKFDSESERIWKEVLLKAFGSAQDHKIFKGDVTKNWWSRSGAPDNMPVGEPGGPDTEVYYKFEDLEHSEKCEGDDPTKCECGKFLEIANAVFMQYVKTGKGFENLPKQNVDFGGGLERLLAAVENKSDIFQTSLFSPIIRSIEKITRKEYKSNKKAMQIIVDHLIASVFIIAGGVTPSNKEQGYILRRLLRRAIRYGKQLGTTELFTAQVAFEIIDNYSDTDAQLTDSRKVVRDLLIEEEKKFNQVIQDGLKLSEKIFSTLTPIDSVKYSKIMQTEDKKEIFREIFKRREIPNNSVSFGLIKINDLEKATLTGKQAFDLFQSFGFPVEIIIELAQEKRLFVDLEDFKKELKLHQDISRKGAGKKFAGGLADHSDKTVMGHTATHLLHQALRDVLGNHVFQTGSNITSERVRFDFNYDRSLTADELKKVEDTVNKKIAENLPVHFEIMPLQKAKDLGAIGLFDDKYQKDVKVYFVGDYSREFCGGPHVDFTGKLKRFKIIKQENIGNQQRRIYAKIHD